MSDQLIPRAPRRMKQPIKAVLYEQLAVAASELERVHALNERLTEENQRLRKPWWMRIWRKDHA